MPTLSTVSRLSLKNILVPTDFSPASQDAVPFAQTLAETYGSTVLFAHAVAPQPHRRIVTERIPEEDEAVWQDARQKLDTFAHEAACNALTWKTMLSRGDVADVIPKMIAEHGVDLIVLGTHGRRGVSKMILGSQAEKIYRQADCPVLVVGPKVRPTDEWKLRQILYPVDRSVPELALHYALSLAEENQSSLLLMEAFPLVPWQHREGVERSSRRAMEDLVPRQAGDWCNPEYVVRWEQPGEAIVSLAQKREVDLIVMSVHRSHVSSRSHLPWPLSSEVIGQVHCPVLTIRV